uniref:Uncharacterized protein n=1 Tax=Geladintestivirus 5 TaxID=3233137 RepID=A0AAU8MHB6_9CAUD
MSQSIKTLTIKTIRRTNYVQKISYRNNNS